MTVKRTGALAGLRVLDMSRVLAAPWAGQFLADLGADVIKVERPGTGDDGRGYGSAPMGKDGQPIPGAAAFHLVANRNKRSLTVDLTTPQGQQVIRELIPHMDVLLENFLPGVMARFGLDYDAVHKLNPRLVYCSLTGYGHGGLYSDRPGYDAVFQAQSGMMAVTGLPDGVPGGGPMKTGPSYVDVTTGWTATVGILAALSYRDRISGEGQHVDAALMDTAVYLQSHVVQEYLVTGAQPQRNGTATLASHPARVFRAADGYIFISAAVQQQYVKFCKLLAIPQLSEDPRFATSQLRHEHRELWNSIVEPVIATRRRRELLDELVGAKVPCALVNSYDEVFADPHVQGRGLKVRMDHELAASGAIDMIASPVRLSASPVAYELRPPLLGEHTDEVLEELLGWDAARIAAARDSGAI